MSIIAKEYIFIHNPKTAGSAMEDIVGGKSHQTLYEFSLETNIALYWKWMFVRNPYSRIVSAYQYHLSHGYMQPMKFPEYIKNLTEFFDFRSQYYVESDGMKRPHIIPQYYFCCIGGENKCDFIGRFETLEQDWEKVCEEIGTTQKLKKTNTTHHGHYLEYMTDDIIERINDLYRKDFKLFNYEML